MSRPRQTPTVDEFVLELRSLVPLLDSRLTTFCHHLVAEIADQGVVTPGQWGPGTPIDTSFARRSWRFGLDRPTPGPVKPETDTPLPPPLDLSTLGQLSLEQVAYLTSDCEYMNDLEFGHSQQAPAGMIRTTLSQLEPMAEYIIAMLRANGWQRTY